MKIIKTMTLTLGATALLATSVLADGLDDINPDVRERLYNPEMLDPAQPIEASLYKDFIEKARRLGRSVMPALMQATRGALARWTSFRM